MTASWPGVTGNADVLVTCLRSALVFGLGPLLMSRSFVYSASIAHDRLRRCHARRLAVRMLPRRRHQILSGRRPPPSPKWRSKWISGADLAQRRNMSNPGLGVSVGANIFIQDDVTVPRKAPAASCKPLPVAECAVPSPWAVVVQISSFWRLLTMYRCDRKPKMCIKLLCSSSTAPRLHHAPHLPIYHQIRHLLPPSHFAINGQHS